MNTRNPIILDKCIWACHYFSYLIAWIHYYTIAAGISSPPVYLLNTGFCRHELLRDIWRTRIVRRLLSVLVRSPFRQYTLRIVKFSIPLPTEKGCVIVFCHTPWRRLLVQWCIDNDFGQVIADNQPIGGHLLNQSCGTGYKELRAALNLLKKGGRIIVAADVFNTMHDCPVQFLGAQQNASLFPIRLAKAGEVPLITAVPVLHKSRIDFIEGPRNETTITKQKSCKLIQDIVTFLDNRIKERPSIWQSYVS